MKYYLHMYHLKLISPVYSHRISHCNSPRSTGSAFAATPLRCGGLVLWHEITTYGRNARNGGCTAVMAIYKLYVSISVGLKWIIHFINGANC